MNLSNNNDKKSKKSGIASLFGGRGSVSKIGKSQFPKSMGGIMERLKGLSRKDLAMVGIGLSVLVAAPVAEYMMSKPADSANMLTSGFSSRDAQGTSALASLYEPGINALSQGSADGSGEVITPLSARDPSTLILGANPEQPPMPDFSSVASSGMDSSSGTTTPPDYNDMRDSVKDSAKRGAVKAMGDAGPRTQITRMQGAFTGGFGVIKSGGSTRTDGSAGSKGLSAPSKANVGAKQSTMVNPVASAGYKGAASTPNSADSSAADKLRAKAAVQGGYFSGASATKAADSAYGVKMNEKLGDASGSGFGGTGYGGGAAHQGFKNSNVNGHYKPFSNCTTLACKAAETRQQHALQWEKYLKYDLPQKFIEMGVDIFKNFASESGKRLTQLIWNEDVEGVTTYYCLTKIDKKAAYCANNAKIIKSSKKGKTIGNKDWLAECDCGVYTMSECKKNYDDKVCSKDGAGQSGNAPSSGNNNGNGNQGGNGAENNNSHNNNNANTGNANGQNDGSQQDTALTEVGKQFEQFVKSYDEGLQKFMGEMSQVMKNSSNADGIAPAIKAADTYTSNIPGEGFGAPYTQIHALVATEASRDKELFSKNRHLASEVQTSIAEADREKAQLIKQLNQIKNKPNTYLEAYGDNKISAISKEEMAKIIDPLINQYEGSYAANVQPQKQLLEGHMKALDVFDAYIQNSSSQNESVYREYNPAAIANVNEISKSLKQTSGKDPKVVISEFLAKMTGTPSLETQLNSLSGAAANGGKSFNAVNPNLSPSQLAREWRGLGANFGADPKQSASIQKQYQAKTLEITNKEKANWRDDCPLRIDADYTPKDKMPDKDNPKMTKTDFYAPGYRLIVEIPIALQAQNKAMSVMTGNINRFRAYKSVIEAKLKEYHISLTPVNNSQLSAVTEKAKCAEDGNCTYKDVKNQERYAQKYGNYSHENNVSIWNNQMLYKDLPPAWQKDAVDGSSYNVNAVKTHVARAEYDDINRRLFQAKENGDQEKVEEYSNMLSSKESELKELVNATNNGWAEICMKNGGSKNYCYNGVSPVSTTPTQHSNGNTGSTGNNANTGNTGNTGSTGNAGGMPKPSTDPVINPPLENNGVPPTTPVINPPLGSEKKSLPETRAVTKANLDNAPQTITSISFEHSKDNDYSVKYVGNGAGNLEQYVSLTRLSNTGNQNVIVYTGNIKTGEYAGKDVSITCVFDSVSGKYLLSSYRAPIRRIHGIREIVNKECL